MNLTKTFLRKQKVLDMLLQHRYIIAISLILVIVSALVGYRYIVNAPDTKLRGTNEIEQILATNDLSARADLYKALIKRVGPEQAQDDLLKSGLPFTGETHLLNHTVGEYIFEEYGVSGITKCRNYFLESCYHGLLMHVIRGDATKDLADIRIIMKHCKEAGPTVSSQCAHGIGHGYVAAVGYANLDQGLAQCQNLGNLVEGFPVFNCLDGGFMENIWAVHTGKPSPDRWVKDTDDFYPCNHTQFEQPVYSEACWSNQPSLLYQRYQGNISKVGEVCLQVSPNNRRETCFNGLARQIHPLTQNKIDSVYAMCGQLPTDWHEYCHTTIVNAAFSVGDRKLPFEMCERATGASKDNCYAHLVGTIRGSSSDTETVRRTCQLISEKDQASRQQCIENL